VFYRLRMQWWNSFTLWWRKTTSLWMPYFSLRLCQSILKDGKEDLGSKIRISIQKRQISRYWYTFWESVPLLGCLVCYVEISRIVSSGYILDIVGKLVGRRGAWALFCGIWTYSRKDNEFQNFCELNNYFYFYCGNDTCYTSINCSKLLDVWIEWFR